MKNKKTLGLAAILAIGSIASFSTANTFDGIVGKRDVGSIDIQATSQTPTSVIIDVTLGNNFSQGTDTMFLYQSSSSTPPTDPIGADDVTSDFTNGVNTASITVDSMTPGTTMYFTVLATDGGSTLISNTIDVVFSDWTANLTTTAAGSTSTSLTYDYTITPTNGGNSSSDYQLKYTVDGGAETNVSLSSLTGQIVISSLEADSSYDLVFNLYSSVTNTLISNDTKTGQTSDWNATISSFSFASKTSNSLTFNYGISSTNGATASDLILEYSQNGGSNWDTVAPFSSLSGQFTISSLSSGTSYDVQIRVKSSASGSVLNTSTTITETTEVDASITFTQNNTLTTTTSLSIDYVITPESAETAADFKVKYSTNNGTNFTTITPTSLTDNLEVTGLTVNTTYQVIFQVTNLADVVLDTATMQSLKTKDYSATLNTPTISNETLLSLDVNYEINLGLETTLSNITLWYAFGTSTGPTNWTQETLTANTGFITISGLASGTNYFVALQVRSTANGTETLDTKEVTGSTTAPLEASISSVSYVSQTLNSATFQYTLNIGNSVAPYNVEWSVDSGVNWTADSQSTGGVKTLVIDTTSLQPGDYTFIMRVNSGAATSPINWTRQVVLVSATYTSVTHNSVVINVNANLGSISSSLVNLTYRPNGTGSWFNVTGVNWVGNEATFEIDGLTSDTTYNNFEISANAGVDFVTVNSFTTDPFVNPSITSFTINLDLANNILNVDYYLEPGAAVSWTVQYSIDAGAWVNAQTQPIAQGDNSFEIDLTGNQINPGEHSIVLRVNNGPSTPAQIYSYNPILNSATAALLTSDGARINIVANIGTIDPTTIDIYYQVSSTANWTLSANSTVNSNGTGYFDVLLAQGIYDEFKVSLFADGSNSVAVSQFEIPAPGNTQLDSITVSKTSQRAWVDFNVTIGSGVSPSELNIAYKIFKTTETPPVTWTDSGATIQADGTGRFEITNLIPGTDYTVVVKLVQDPQSEKTQNFRTPDGVYGTVSIGAINVSYTSADVSFTYTPGIDDNSLEYSINSGITWQTLTAEELNNNLIHLEPLQEDTSYTISIRINNYIESSSSQTFRTLAYSNSISPRGEIEMSVSNNIIIGTFSFTPTRTATQYTEINLPKTSINLMNKNNDSIAATANIYWHPPIAKYRFEITIPQAPTPLRAINDYIVDVNIAYDIKNLNGDLVETEIMNSNQLVNNTSPDSGIEVNIPSPSSNNGLSAGAITWIVIGSVVGAALIGYSIYYFNQRRNISNKSIKNTTK